LFGKFFFSSSSSSFSASKNLLKTNLFSLSLFFSFSLFPPPPQAEPDVTRTELSAGDSFLLLACDGVWDVLTNQGAADVIIRELNSGKSPAEAAAALLDACLSPDPRTTRGAGGDNMTAAVVLLPTRVAKVVVTAAAAAVAVVGGT
jgi:serine/threonine protein phosphatase PrpC